MKLLLQIPLLTSMQTDFGLICSILTPIKSNMKCLLISESPCSRIKIVNLHTLNFFAGIHEPRLEVFATPVLLNEVKSEGSVLLFLINVCDSSQERAQNDFCVVFKKVDLHCAISQLHHNSPEKYEKMTFFKSNKKENPRKGSLKIIHFEKLQQK